MTEGSKIPSWLHPALVLALYLLLLLPAAGRFGISSPWELERATRALDIATGQAQWFDIQSVEGEGDVAPLPVWVAALGFKALGASETAGRLPAIMLLVCAAMFTFWVVRRLLGERTAYFTVVVLASFPLTGITTFFIGGEGPVVSILAFSLGGLAASRWWCYRPADGSYDQALQKQPLRWVALAAAMAGIAAGYYAIGGLVGILLPVSATFLAGIFDGDWEYAIPSRARARLNARGMADAIFAGAVAIGFCVAAALIVPVLLSGEPTFDLLAGGTPKVGLVPTFDYYLVHVAYGLYPWSGFLAVALAALLIPQVMPAGDEVEKSASSAPRLFFLLANFMAFACYSFFAFRYGKEPYGALVPAAVAIGVLLSDLERANAGWRIAGFIGCAFVLLFFRDLHVYPNSMSEAWAITGLDEAFPTKLVPKLPQMAVTGLFLAVVFLVFVQGSREVTQLSYFGLLDGARRAFNGWWGRKWRIGAIAIAAAWGLAFVNAVLVIVATLVQDSGGTVIVPFALYGSLIKKASIGLGFLPLAVIAGDLAFRSMYNGVAAARSFRLDMVMGATVFVAFYFSFSYLPGVSMNMSPRAGLEAFFDKAPQGEELIAFRTPGDVGRFYRGGKPIREISNQAELFKIMDEPRRVWFFFKREEAPSLDLAYKETRHDHIPVVDASSWRFLLATNKPFPGAEQKNPIAEMVLLAPPKPMFTVFANLDNKVEYLGYDIETKHMKVGPDGRRDIWAGAMESFTITTYWHCTGRVNGSHQFFIHVDGLGLRLNGDHDVLDGRYPVRYWRPGDYLVDRFKMEVPIHFRPGDYNIYMGLFQGDDRMPQVSGPGQDDRVLAGILRVK